MARKRSSVFNESKDRFIARMKKRGTREYLHEDPLSAADRSKSIGKDVIFHNKII